MSQQSGTRKYIFSATLLLSMSLILPAPVVAHGGISQIGGDIIVTAIQTPLSPLVGESVSSTYIFTDSSYHRLAGKDIALTLIDTFHGDESKDRTIHTQRLTTDVNGQIEFRHTFTKANYFDVDLDFADISGKPQTVGFLIETRAPIAPHSQVAISATIGIGIGVVIGFIAHMYIIGRRRKR